MSTDQLTDFRGASSIEDAYRAANEAVGLVDRSSVGRLQVIGEDALDLLDRLSTNHLQDLAPGRGLHTVLTTNKGRIVDLLFVLARGDDLLVFTGRETRQKVAEWIDFYTFTEDVSVEDVTDATAMLSLVGPKAAALFEELSGLNGIQPYESASVAIGGVDSTAVRTDFLRLPSYDLVLPPDGVDAVRQTLLAAGESHGMAEVDPATLDLVRIEQGVPAHGKELTEDANPLEAGLIDHISFNKGCYIGQEVVARLNTYDKVQRTLVGLSWDVAVKADAGAEVLADGKKVGILTSAAVSSRLERSLGLGLVKNSHAEPGNRLSIAGGAGAAVVTVEALPAT